MNSIFKKISTSTDNGICLRKKITKYVYRKLTTNYKMKNKWFYDSSILEVGSFYNYRLSSRLIFLS